ncbi:glycosyltransferase family 4 protein [Grimontia hollisae]|uniref:glycosyltransferase family 4 protein n=1 Tax=Grimontia hollisae TaxID=673 RepID=UPI000E046914|nr:glycosyltransferase family 4 protein [Grimontia hollisae]STQ74764.1 Glycogen synthase [Grimontia hollisae]
MKLVVVPSESIDEYELKGLDRLGDYYNPNGYFDEVLIISPLEKKKRQVDGLTIIPVKNGKEFSQVLSEIKPNAVRAYGGYWASSFVAKYSPENIPIVCSVHDTNMDLLYSGVKYFDHIICMTNAVKNKVIHYGVKNIEISLLPNRVSIEEFSNPSKMTHIDVDGINLDEFINRNNYILHIGRRNQQKNLETVIRALSNLPEEVKLITIGQGCDKVYRKLARELKVSDRVLFVDKVRNACLPSIYQKAIAFVLPTRWEGFGVVFIEAAAASVPIVSSNIPPVNEFLVNGHNAVLLDSFEDYNSIAHAVNQIMRDKEFSNVLKVNAFNTAREFSRENINNMEIDIYKKIILEGVRRKKIPVLAKFYMPMELRLKKVKMKLKFHWKRLVIR